MADVTTITLDMTEVNALARRLGIDAMPAVQAELEPAMRRVLLPAQRIAVGRAKHDTGHFRRSITTTVTPIPGGVVGRIGSNVQYAKKVEEDGTPVGEWIPKGTLVRSGWLRRHGIPDSREYLIRRAIARRGIKPTHNIRGAVADRETAARAEFAGIGPRVIQRLITGGR